ncbi:MAG: hypothetical protein O7E52_05450 [Candidatus Poribacteria bacterium]|nr:hypothetical protein [Candidatus Poribacteria bacterium]
MEELKPTSDSLPPAEDRLEAPREQRTLTFDDAPKNKVRCIMKKLSGDITWDDLQFVDQLGSDGSRVELWNRIEEDALDGLTSGAVVCAATAEHSPYRHALCLATRKYFSEEWNPRGGVEQTLIDLLAQIFVKWQMYLKAEVKWSALGDKYAWSDWPEPKPEPHMPPRLDYAEAARQAAQMADRSHRQFMRTLRALRDLRRYAANITINNEGPLSVGGNQQVNIADSARDGVR